MGSIPAGNDPFIGGSKTPNAPPPALGGSIAPAQTSVSNPIAGVNPGAPFFARNNRGSNIGIPYLRLCPLGGERNMMGLGRPPMPEGEGENPNIEPVITETNDLRATKLAFILGRRSAEMAGIAGRELVDRNGDSIAGSDRYDGDSAMYDYGFQLTINSSYAPGVPGTERFQKLCSFEYLQRYFTNVLCNKGINLGVSYSNQDRTINPGKGGLWDSGLARAANAAAYDRDKLRAAAVARGGNADDVGPAIGDELVGSSMLVMPDLAKVMSYTGAKTLDESSLRQGIFTRDTGPFLRGKTGMVGATDSTLVSGTKDDAPFAVTTENGSTKHVDPFHISRTAGDELAFGLLERMLEEKGLTDWRPDGVVLSLGADDPSDTLSDEYFKAREGQLYNVRVQGPAISSSWTGDPALETMPLDKVFVVIVADVWWGTLDGVGEDGHIKTFVDKVAPLTGSGSAASPPKLEELRAYLRERNKELDGNQVKTGDVAGFATDATAELNADKPANGTARSEQTSRLCNFRVQVATSSQMINYSGLRFDRDGTQVVSDDFGYAAAGRDKEFMRVPNQSRMGLRLGKNGGEYIVGGWCIGNVLDTSASRGTMPGTGSSIGVRTAPNSMALNVNVQIDWWDADRMWRCFMNKAANNNGVTTGSFAPRYGATVPDANIDPINKKQIVPEIAIGS
jgi:hypothetical protein